MTERVDVAVIGAGIVGLATAFRLLEDRPELSLAVLEKEQRVGAHQSSHNSGVLHAGLYYHPGSLKSRLCQQGKRELEAFAARHAIPVAHVGKVVVATEERELPGLAALRERAERNGVPGLASLTPAELAEVEPHAVGVAALHSPHTAVIDFARVCDALAGEVRERGGRILLGHEVADLAEEQRGVTVVTSAVTLRAGTVVSCAGLQSDRVAALTGDADSERIVPFRGSYLRLRDGARDLVRGNIYPVPDPRFPFLGVHFTRRIDGEVWAGPTAGLTGAREGYERGSVRPRDIADMLGFPGFWRLLARYPRAAVRELVLDRVTAAQVRALRRYVPALTRTDVEPGPCGIRAQTVRPDGTLVDDFSIAQRGRIVHVRNAPSPAATSALAIGSLLAQRVVGRSGH